MRKKRKNRMMIFLTTPMNLPLGWDGKPIPYWLYKLHGLNLICGNFPYKGPKAFQKHFAEWRHAHGMRCLGIPNNAHFANVTQIEDAMSLCEKLKEEAWKSEHEQEFEDSKGNVVNQKTLKDLKIAVIYCILLNKIRFVVEA